MSSASCRAALSETTVSRGRQLDDLLGLDSCLQLASALEFGVELGTEQQRGVGEPEPQEEHDRSAQRAVRAVVVAEPADVERESEGTDDPEHDRQQGTDAHPPEARLLHVRGRVVQHRDDHRHHEQHEGPLRIAPDGQHRVRQSEPLIDLVRQSSGQCRTEEQDRGADDDDQADEDVERAQLPHWPTLVDLVDAVHRPSERADVGRRAPERSQGADDQRKARAVRLGERGDRPAELIGDIALTEIIDQAEQRVGGPLTLADQPDEGGEHDEGREHGGDRVERERRGKVRALVALVLGERHLRRVHPRTLVKVGRRLRLARIIRIRRCDLLLGGSSLECRGHERDVPLARCRQS